MINVTENLPIEHATNLSRLKLLEIVRFDSKADSSIIVGRLIVDRSFSVDKFVRMINRTV